MYNVLFLTFKGAVFRTFEWQDKFSLMLCLNTANSLSRFVSLEFCASACIMTFPFSAPQQCIFGLEAKSTSSIGFSTEGF